jgi:Family of unknown function (DUF6463)
MRVSELPDHATPADAIKVIGVGHAAWGLLAYRRPLREIAADPLDSVGDGIFAKDHSADGRAAAFWFLLAAPLIVLCGHLVGAAERSGDEAAMRTAGRTVTVIGALGTAAMPRSGFLAVFPVGFWLTRRARA